MAMAWHYMRYQSGSWVLIGHIAKAWMRTWFGGSLTTNRYNKQCPSRNCASVVQIFFSLVYFVRGQNVSRDFLNKVNIYVCSLLVKYIILPCNDCWNIFTITIVATLLLLLLVLLLLLQPLLPYYYCYNYYYYYYYYYYCCCCCCCFYCCWYCYIDLINHAIL